MKNSLHEIKEIQWDWDEDDNGDVAEFVVIDGEKYIDVSYFNQKLKEKEDRFELHKNTDAKTIQDQSDLIEELKAKLAESENTITNLIEDNRASQEWYKKQLEEKDKKIEKLKSENHALISDNAYQEADMFELTQKLAIQDQDKISFCIEKLEKVKELVEEKGAISSPFGNLKIQASDVSEIIDNQIKAIKEIK